MGCLSSTPSNTAEASKIDTRIDDHQKKANKIDQLKYKLLLLGAGESGKSTLLRQMRSLHGRQFDQSELLAAKPHLTQNVIEAMRTLAIYSDLLGDQGRDTKVLEENKEIRDRVARMSDKQKFTKEHYDDFIKLWSDPHIKKTLEYRNQFQLIDTVEYLFDNMHKYYQDEYIPTFTDLLHSRQRTTGVNKIKFVLNDRRGDVEEIYEIFDVGGQKNERRKWMHFFDNATAIIFVAALSGYNQLLWEDNRNNRMREAIGLFRGIVNLEVTKNTHIILFLNKQDLFEKKVGKYPVKEYFKDFDGEEKSEDIIRYFKQKFKDQRRERRTNGGNGSNTVALKNEIHFHVTCATDTACVKKMFESCRTIIIKNELRDNGFI